MKLERNEPIVLNSSWSCSIPNLSFLPFALLSFSFKVSDSANNGKIASFIRQWGSQLSEQALVAPSL